MSKDGTRTAETNGFAKLPKAILARRDLTPTAKLVVAFVTDAMRGNGAVQIGVRRIAGGIGCDKETVFRCLGNIEGSGVLLFKRGTRGQRITYRLPPEVSAECGQSEASPKADKGTRKTPSVRKTRTEVSAKPVHVKTKTKKSKSYGLTAATPPPAPRKQTTKPSTGGKPRNALFEAVAEIFDLETETKGGCQRVGGLARDFKALEATHDELVLHVERHRAQWPNMEASPESIRKHWNRFSRDRKTKTTAARVEGDKFAELNSVAAHGGKNGKPTLVASVG